MTKYGKIAVGFWLLCAVFILVYKGIRPGWNDKATDFNNYYASAKLLRQGQPIHSFYSNEGFKEMAKSIGVESGAKFSPFPPPTAVLYWPISFFDLMTAKRIWLALNLLLLCWLPFRMKRFFKSDRWKHALVISLFVVPLSSNLHFGQFYFVTTFLLIEAVGCFFVSKRVIFPSVLIAALASVKYIPMLFLGYFLKLSRESIKPIFIGLTTIVAITGIFALMDFEAYEVYLRDLEGHVNGDLSGQGKFAIGFQSLDALFNHLFVFDAIENPQPFVQASWLKPVLKWFVFGIVGLIGWLMLRKEKYAFTPSTVSIGILGAFVLVPASASYHFLLLILPVFFIVKWLNEERGIRDFLIVIILILGAFSIQAHQIPNLERWPLLNLLIHFPRLWFLLMLFTYVAYCKLRTKND